MSSLSRDISAYDDMRRELEIDHSGKWVVFHDEDLAGVYESFDRAASDAVRRFGRGPYLIREIGAPPLALPASVLHRTAPDSAGS